MENVLVELDKRAPASVGLELRADYETSGMRIGFFGDIYTRLKEKGRRLFLLESPELWDDYKAVEITKAMHEGAVSIPQIRDQLFEIERRIEMAKSPYVAPEMRRIEPLIEMKGRLQKALKANEEFPTPEALLGRWKELNSLRSAHFLARILETLPDIAVVGLGHAVEIEARLCGRYVLEDFGQVVGRNAPKTADGSDLF